MEVGPGFKLTDFGVIPNDWEEVLLDSIAKRGSGHTPDKAHPEYWGGPIKWISLQDSGRLDRLYIEDTAAKITPAGIANSSARLHPKGTVVLSRDAGVGKSSIMMCDMAVSQHFMAWTCGPRLSNRFLYYWLQFLKPELERIAMGNTIKTIGLPYFRQLTVPLPDRAEQEAIADALSDADTLIESLDQLVAKKRQIKHGVLQELITDQKRLPGFNGTWELKRLGDCLYGSPQYGINAPAVPFSDRLPAYIRITDITQHGNYEATPPVSVNSSFAHQYYLNEGDLVFARTGASVGKSYRYDPRDGQLVFAGFLIRVHPIPHLLHPRFLAAFATTAPYWNWVRVMSMRSGQPGINGKEFAQLPIKMPDTEEQSAIAAILSDMDAEIAAVEAKVAKARLLKQGMMQELLTGRIRLV